MFFTTLANTSALLLLGFGFTSLLIGITENVEEIRPKYFALALIGGAAMFLGVLVGVHTGIFNPNL